MREPTQEEIRQAQEFILKRIDAEITSSRRLDDYLLVFAEKIVRVALKYQIEPKLFRFSVNSKMEEEINSLLEELKYLLQDETYFLCQEYNKKIDGILEYANRNIEGKTFLQRLNIYIHRFKMELEGAIALGLIASLNEKQIVEQIAKFMNSPYNNPHYNDYWGVGMKATRVKTHGVSYGVGRYNGARNMLELLLRYTISSTWMHFYGKDHADSIGFISMRGSSYDCPYCDDMVGFHPIEEYQGQWHPRCKCVFIFM